MGSFDCRYDLIGRGKSGWHAAGVVFEFGRFSSVSSSGGAFKGYVESANEGALVYDADGADEDAFITLVFKGPMCKPGLPPGTVKRFSLEERKAAVSMLPGLSGGFADLAAMALAGLSSLDEVAVDVYEACLRAVPGMKIGHVRNGSVEWEG